MAIEQQGSMHFGWLLCWQSWGGQEGEVWMGDRAGGLAKWVSCLLVKGHHHHPTAVQWVPVLP